ncbi:hypothetical protein D1122_15195 [Cereibacter sphaeroides]|nr:hypothetical protein D1122_15195 [Cereibacter sphaeroides]
MGSLLRQVCPLRAGMAAARLPNRSPQALAVVGRRPPESVSGAGCARERARSGGTPAACPLRSRSAKAGAIREAVLLKIPRLAAARGEAGARRGGGRFLARPSLPGRNRESAAAPDICGMRGLHGLREARGLTARKPTAAGSPSLSGHFPVCPPGARILALACGAGADLPAPPRRTPTPRPCASRGARRGCGRTGERAGPNADLPAEGARATVRQPGP